MIADYDVVGNIELELADMERLLAMTSQEDVVFLKEGTYSHIIEESARLLVDYVVDSQDESPKTVEDALTRNITRLLEILSSAFGYGLTRVKDDLNGAIRNLPVEEMKEAARQKQTIGLH